MKRTFSKYYTNVFDNIPNFVKIIEVGPRDGLQNEKQILSLRDKLTLIEKLEKSNIKNIEVASFVNPKLVPQMADSNELVKNLYVNNTIYSALVPNLKGFKQGIYQTNIYTPDTTIPIKEIVLFTAASETFNKKNTNATIDESFKRFEEVAKEAYKNKIAIRGSISCCLGCPYEGYIHHDKVINVIKRYADLGVQYIDIADTIGVGTPKHIHEILNKGKIYFSIDRLTGHFHDTSDTALDLVDACLEHGMSIFHSSIGGLGGCPFSPKRAGNLSTEKLVEHLHSRHIDTGIDLNSLKETSKWIKTILKKEN
jgi:hydroxymethylglutaryl-CoA lyase